MPPYRSNPFLFAPDDGAGGGGDPLGDAGDAAQARLDEAAATPADGAGLAPSPSSPSAPSPEADPWAPIHEQLGRLSERDRQTFVESLPDLADDLGPLAASMRHVDPADRQFFMRAADLIYSSDPADRARAVEMFQQAAEALQGDTQPPAGDDVDLLADNAGLTAANVEQMVERRIGEERQRVEQERLMEEISREARGLGYDPDAPDDSPETARFESLLSLAARNGGNLPKAHELLEADTQRRIDAYVAERREAALRPSAPVAGGSPSPQRGPATTLEEAEARMEERLNSALGTQ